LEVHKKAVASLHVLETFAGQNSQQFFLSGSFAGHLAEFSPASFSLTKSRKEPRACAHMPTDESQNTRVHQPHHKRVIDGQAVDLINATGLDGFVI